MMVKKTYAEELESARRMLTGMKSHTECFHKHGIDENYIIQFEKAINEATALYAKPKIFIFRPKAKAALQERVSVISKLTTTGKKLVKLDYPRESWREFGIIDQR